MAINLMCMNARCKYYWEDSCMNNIMEKRMNIDESGVCQTFEVGRSEWYEDFGMEYDRGKPTSRNLDKEEEDAYSMGLKKISKPTGRRLNL